MPCYNSRGSRKMSISDLKQKINNLPSGPGVYLFMDGKGHIIYVGKAKSLKDRVKSYTGRSRERGPRIDRLRSDAMDIQYIVTSGEMEALGLENNLIKEHRPKYNVLLRDDKTFPYILITTGDPFPRAYIVRKVKRDNHSYFGPIIPGGRARHLLRILNESFNLRQCRGGIEGKSARSCLYFQMGKCRGPCSGFITKTDYRASVKDAVDFLRGKGDELAHDLEKRMGKAAIAEDFETAAYYRDLIHSVSAVSPFIQRVASSRKENVDVLGVFIKNGRAACQLFILRNGEIRDQKRFFSEGVLTGSRLEVLRSAVVHYYRESGGIPHTIVLQELPDDSEIILKCLSNIRGKRVRFAVPERGDMMKLLRLATQNAEHALSQQDESEKETDFGILGIPGCPHRIDAFDISTIQGSDTVASMVVWINGSFRKENFRKFTIKGLESVDDPASIAQAVERRYSRVKSEGLELPDLILIDGGITQVNAASCVLKKIGFSEIKVVGLAKKEELIFFPETKEPLRLDRDSPALKVLQKIRDEAHRFAVEFHRKKRSRRMLSSELENIRGIGKTTAGRLLKTFGSIKKIVEADEKTLARLTNRITARNIREYFSR